MTKYVDVYCQSQDHFEAILLQFVSVGTEIRAIVQRCRGELAGHILDVSIKDITAPTGGGLS